MSDDDLQVALAVALGWTSLIRTDGGELRGDRPRVLSQRPFRVPDWPRDAAAAESLDAILDARGLAQHFRRRRSMQLRAGKLPARTLSEIALDLLSGDPPVACS